MCADTSLDRLEGRVADALARCGVDCLVRPDRAVRLLEFGAVGATGALLNAGIFLAGASSHAYLLPGAAAFFLAACWTFLLNWRVTFDRPEGALFSRFCRYLSGCVGGFLLYAGALATAIEVVHLARPAANAGAVLLGGLWNFFGSEWFALADGFG